MDNILKMIMIACYNINYCTLPDVAIIAIFVAVGMPIELYGDYRNYTFLKRCMTFIDIVEIARR